MKQDTHRLAGHLSLVEPPCKCKLAELEERVDRLSQQVAGLLQMFLDLKGEPR